MLRSIIPLTALFLLSICVKAQGHALQDGDTIPDHFWKIPLSVVNDRRGNEVLYLEDHRDKLVILDFWATWCTPCIRSIGKLDSLREALGNKFVVIPVTYEAGQVVIPVVDKHQWRTAIVVADSVLRTYFPHHSLPHQVWLKNDRVLAITGAEYNDAEQIMAAMSARPPAFKQRKAIQFEKGKPLFLDGNGGAGDNMLYQSVISGRLSVDIGGVYSASPNSVMAYNQTISQLYKAALGGDISSLISHRYTIYEVEPSLKDRILPPLDKLKLREQRQHWLDSNLYCYSLTLPASQGEPEVYKRMVVDLNNFFAHHLNLVVSIETRSVKTLALVQEKQVPGLSAKSGANHRHWDRLANKLELQDEPLATLIHYINVALDLQEKKGVIYPYPVSDQTGIHGTVNLELNASLSDFHSLNSELSRYGLALVEMEAPVMFIVFKKFSNET